MLAVSAAALGLVAWWLYRYEREEAWKSAAEELVIIARAKVAQLEAWREERKNDAAFLSRAGFVAKDVEGVLAAPGSATARHDVLSWLTSIKGGERYAEVILFDPSGRAIVSVPENASGANSPRLRQILRETVAQPQVQIRKLGRDGPGAPAFLEVVAPIFASGAGVMRDAGAGPERAIAIVVLRIKPEGFVEPLLGAWPTVRRTAEAVLVCPEGEDFVFLNQLRFRSGNTLPLRRAISEPTLAAARALRSEREVMHALDYRGEPVVAFFRPVQGTDCLLGVKIDEAEINASIQPRVESLLATVAALGLALTGGIGWFWRGRETELLRRELASDAARLESEERFRLLASTIDEVVWVAEVTPVRFIYVSPAAARVWGCAPEALLARPETLLEAVHPEDRPAALAKLALMRKGAVFEHEHRVVHAGVVRWVRVRAFPIQPAEGGAITQYAGAAEDITERQQALEQLRAREARLALLARATSDVVWDFDVGTGELWWGDTVDSVFGCTRAELGTSVAEWAQRLHPEDFSRVRRKLQEALEGTTGAWRDEYRFRRDDGTYASIADRGIIVRDAAGRAVRMVGGMSDVTTRLRLEAELAQRERQLDAFFANATAGLVVLDRELRYVKINDTFAAMNGLPTAEHLGRRVDEILPDVAPTVLPLLRRVVEAGESFPNVEVSGRTPQEPGVVRHWLESYFPVLDASGTPEFVGAVVIEISALHRANAAVRESEQRFRQLAENIAEVFWIASPALDALFYVSPAYARIWGRSVESVCAQPGEWLEHVHAEDRARVALARGSAAQGKYEEVYRVLRPDGVVRWVRDRAFPIRDAAGAVYRLVGVAEDITERRELEEQFQQAQKMEALGTLAGGIAHDFNNILASINGYTALAKMSASRGAEIGEYLEEVLRASARAAELVRQILAFSRRQEHTRVSLQLATIVGESVRLLRATLPATIDFDISLPKPLAPVLADPTQIHQIVMNLGTNAWHAMRDCKGVLGVRLTEVNVGGEAGLVVAQLKPGKYLQLEVSDTGHGMSAAVRERIFEPFFTTKPPGEGTGLGLSVVHGIVRAHEGEIIVESEPGKGTRFRVLFPAASAGAAPAAPRAAKVPRGNGERVLLIDDEEAIVRMQRIALEHFGYAVEAHSRPEDALAAFRAQAGDIAAVVTDFTMPGLTGLELAGEIGRLRPGTPVVLTSGYTAALSEEKLRAAGVTLLISKPTTIDALCTAVHRVLHAEKKA